MKTIIIILLVGFFYSALAQDTTELVVSYDGSKSFILITKKDTSKVCLYSGGRKESVCRISNYVETGTYTRWYENGKMMWKNEMKNGLQHGQSTFYDDKGVKVAVLNYSQGELTDTVFMAANTHLVFGKISYTSRVYGGAIREDGSSNVSEYTGPYANCRMYAVRVDSVKKPEMVVKFKTDYRGDFFIVVPQGNISFFSQEIDIKTLSPGQFFTPGRMTGSTSSHWNEAAPLVVKKEDKIVYVKLHSASEGYAP